MNEMAAANNMDQELNKPTDPVTTRFFAAFAALTEQGRTNPSEFCESGKFNRPNFLKQRREPWRRILRPEWLSLIVQRYGVSADWLLTGRGTMFRKR